jgi:hypothetical protein
MIDYDRLVRSIRDWNAAQRPASGVYARPTMSEGDATPQPYDAVESGMVEEVDAAEGDVDVDADAES